MSQNTLSRWGSGVLCFGDSFLPYLTAQQDANWAALSQISSMKKTELRRLSLFLIMPFFEKEVPIVKLLIRYSLPLLNSPIYVSCNKNFYKMIRSFPSSPSVVPQYLPQTWLFVGKNQASWTLTLLSHRFFLNNSFLHFQHMTTVVAVVVMVVVVVLMCVCALFSQHLFLPDLREVEFV